MIIKPTDYKSKDLCKTEHIWIELNIKFMDTQYAMNIGHQPWVIIKIKHRMKNREHPFKWID